MCNNCGMSGCRHDWQTWQPESFRVGYDAFAKNGECPYPESSYNHEWLAFVAGWRSAESDERGQQNEAERPDTSNG